MGEVKTVTADEVRLAALAAGIKWVDHHECGLCGVMVRYYVDGETLLFDPSCGCTYGDIPRQSSWQNAADWINMQSSPEWRTKIAARFGLAEEARRGE